MIVFKINGKLKKNREVMHQTYQGDKDLKDE